MIFFSLVLQIVRFANAKYNKWLHRARLSTRPKDDTTVLMQNKQRRTKKKLFDIKHVRRRTSQTKQIEPTCGKNKIVRQHRSCQQPWQWWWCGIFYLHTCRLGIESNRIWTIHFCFSFHQTIRLVCAERRRTKKKKCADAYILECSLALWRWRYRHRLCHTCVTVRVLIVWLLASSYRICWW